MQGFSNPIRLSGTEIVADNRLCGLCDGIVHHKDDGEEVAGNAERSYSVFSEMMDKDIIPQKHHTGDGSLTDESGSSQFYHIATVTERQHQAFQT